MPRPVWWCAFVLAVIAYLLSATLAVAGKSGSSVPDGGQIIKKVYKWFSQFLP